LRPTVVPASNAAPPRRRATPGPSLPPAVPTRVRSPGENVPLRPADRDDSGAPDPLWFAEARRSRAPRPRSVSCGAPTVPRSSFRHPHEPPLDSSPQRIPVHRDVNPHQNHEKVEEPVVQQAPGTVLDGGNTQGRQRHHRNDHSRKDFENHEREEQPVQHVVDPVSPSGSRRDHEGGAGDPGPGQEEMYHDGDAKRQPQPLVHWQPGEPRRQQQQYEPEQKNVDREATRREGRNLHGTSSPEYDGETWSPGFTPLRSVTRRTRTERGSRSPLTRATADQ